MQPQPATHALPRHGKRSIPDEPNPTCKSTRSRGKLSARHARRLNGSAACVQARLHFGFITGALARFALL